jgi:hypothetical protein
MLFYNEVEEEHEILCLQGTRVSTIETGIHVTWEIKKRVFSNEINTLKMLHMCVVQGQITSYGTSCCVSEGSSVW